MKTLLISLIVMALLTIVLARMLTRPGSLKRLRRALRLLPLLFEQPKPRSLRPQFANIGEGTHEHGIKSFFADATTSSRYLLYKIGSTADNVALAGAGDYPLGSSDDAVDDVTIPIAIKLFGAIKGTTRVISDGTLVNGSRVKAAANGQTTVAASGDKSFGVALIGTDAVIAAGDAVEIIPALPAEYTF